MMRGLRVVKGMIVGRPRGRGSERRLVERMRMTLRRGGAKKKQKAAATKVARKVKPVVVKKATG